MFDVAKIVLFYYSTKQNSNYLLVINVYYSINPLF